MSSIEAFKQKLDNEHNWPDIYLFKFVVASGKREEFRSLFSDETFKERKSSAGNYISFTLKKTITSSDEVVDIYVKARTIEGLIAL